MFQYLFSLSLLIAVTILDVAFLSPQVCGQIFNSFDSDGSEVYLGTIQSLQPSNWQSSFGGLGPTAGSQFIASGNGNENITFFGLGLTKNLGGVIQDSSYWVQLNTAWYNTGQHGGAKLADFDQLFIGSGNGVMNWVSTPEPVIEDQWYTWTGIFTPAPSDIGQPWTFKMVFDLPPMRDIAIDLPASGFAMMVPEPTTTTISLIATLLFASRRRR